MKHQSLLSTACTRVMLLILQVMPLTAYRQLAQTMTFEMSSENK